MRIDRGLGYILEIPFDIEHSFARLSSSSRARGPERSFRPSRSAIPVKNFLVVSTYSAVFPSAENVASRTAKNSSQLRSLYPINEWNEVWRTSPHPFSVIRRWAIWFPSSHRPLCFQTSLLISSTIKLVSQIALPGAVINNWCASSQSSSSFRMLRCRQKRSAERWEGTIAEESIRWESLKSMGRIDAGVDGSLAFEKRIRRIYASCLGHKLTWSTALMTLQ